jgi:hypothetical protein
VSERNGNGHRITVRFPSGAIEHRYGSAVPEVGDKIGLDGQSGFVAKVQEDGDGDISIEVGRRPPFRRDVAHDAVPNPAA